MAQLDTINSLEKGNERVEENIAWSSRAGPDDKPEEEKLQPPHPTLRLSLFSF